MRQIYARLGDHNALAETYVVLGETVVAVGDDDAAEPHYQRALTEAFQAGSLRHQAEAYNVLGQIARHRGDFRRAYSLLGRALQLYRAASQPSGVATVLNSLGEVARDQGQPSKARRYYHASLRRHAVIGHKRGIAYDLEGFAAAAALEHAAREALVYLGAAQALREDNGSPLPPAEQLILTRILAPAIAALPEPERHNALSEGRNQPLPAIITRALNQLPAQDLDAAEAALQAQVPESVRRTAPPPGAEEATLRPGLRPEGVALRAVRLTGRGEPGTVGGWPMTSAGGMGIC